MRDVAGHVVVLLMDVAVENGHVGIRHQRVDHRLPVARSPVPIRSEVEERAMGENDDRLLLAELGEIGFQPGQLLVTDDRAGIGNVVDDDEMNALVIEGIVELAEEFLERLALIEGGIVLSGQVVNRLHLEPAGDVLEASHTLAAHLVVVRGVRQVAGEDDEVRLLVEAVDRCHGLLERTLGVRIDGRPCESPVGVGELNEVEVPGLFSACLLGGRAELRTTRAPFSGVRS